MSDKSEHKIQQEIVMWFRNNYCLNHHNPKCLIFSVPNDGKIASEQIVKIATGLLKGVSDLIVILPSRVLFIEVKIQSGVQKPEQIQFERDVSSLGFEYYLVRSLENFKTIIT